MVVNSFEQALNLSEAVTQKHFIVGASEARKVDDRTDLNPPEKNRMNEPINIQMSSNGFVSRQLSGV